MALVVIIFSSFNSFNNNLNSSIEFKNIDSLFNLNYGDCSSMVRASGCGPGDGGSIPPFRF